MSITADELRWALNRLPNAGWYPEDTCTIRLLKNNRVVRFRKVDGAWVLDMNNEPLEAP